MTPLEQKLAEKILTDALKSEDPKDVGRHVSNYGNLLYAVRQNNHCGIVQLVDTGAPLNLSVGITETTPAEVPQQDTPPPAKKRARKQAKQADPASPHSDVKGLDYTLYPGVEMNNTSIGKVIGKDVPTDQTVELPAPDAPESNPTDEPEEQPLVQPKEDVITHAAIVERIKEYRRINTPYMVAKNIDHKKLLREVLERFQIDSIPACPPHRLEEFSAAIDEICQPVN